MPEYSVWNPAVSSDSASGRSKGARLVSATAHTRKMKKASGFFTPYHCQGQPPCLAVMA